MPATRSKSKKPEIFCRVCKKYFRMTEKEFKELGHFPNDEKPHLLEPDLGRSSKRHSVAMRKDNDRVLRVALSKQKKEA